MIAVLMTPKMSSMGLGHHPIASIDSIVSIVSIVETRVSRTPWGPVPPGNADETHTHGNSMFQLFHALQTRWPTAVSKRRSERAHHRLCWSPCHAPP